MANEVSAWAVKSHLDVFRKHFQGTLPAGVFAGLPWTEQNLKNLPALGRIDWDPYAELLDRLGAECGSDDAIIEVGRTMEDADQHGVVQRAIKGIVSPGMLLQFWKLTLPRMWTAMEAEVDRPDALHAVLHVRIKDGYRGCRTMFLGSIGSIATMTKRIGLPEVVIEGVPEIDDRHGRYRILIPASETIPAALRRRWRELSV